MLLIAHCECENEFIFYRFIITVFCLVLSGGGASCASVFSPFSLHAEGTISNLLTSDARVKHGFFQIYYNLVVRQKRDLR